MLKYNLWAKFFAEHICEWVLFQWSSKKEYITLQKQSSRDVFPNFTHKLAETDKPYINQITGTDFSFVLKVGLKSFINNNFPFKGVISITFTSYIKFLYFRVFMAFFDSMLYQMGFSISSIMVKYSFWQPSCLFSSIVFWGLTFWTFNTINNIMLLLFCSFLSYLCKFVA